MQDAGAASGFVLAIARLLEGRKGAPRRCLLIADAFGGREAGIVYAPGLADFGLEPGELIHAMPRRIEDALWLADAALVSRAFSVVLLEIHGNPKTFGLTESRRLSLRARDTGGTLYLLRQAGEEEASSAQFRLLVEPAPAVARKLSDGRLLGGSIGHPVFRVLVEKSRSPGLSQFILEWNIHERRLKPRPSAEFASGHEPTHPGDLLSKARHRPDRTTPVGAVLAFDRAS
jgi:protein ImuA